MFCQQPDTSHRHTPIHSLAHVVNGQQADLHRCQCFHLDTGRTYRFHGGSAANEGWCCCCRNYQLKINCHPCQSQWMAQWNQVTGLLGRLNGCDAGNAQHIAFFGGAKLDDGQGCG